MFTDGRYILVRRSRMTSVQRRRAYKAAEKEKQKKCDYANAQFPVTKNTCSAKPGIDYKNLYEKSYASDLWEFQQAHCLPRQYSAVGFLFILVLILVLFAFVPRAIIPA
jgi:CRISPR/Cas system-associated protein Cas7 (RAMP superfamily)